MMGVFAGPRAKVYATQSGRRAPECKLYLVAILDWFSRYVVSWMLSDTLEMPFVLHALDQALGIARPQIWNTDQGSQFTSPHLTALLEAAGVQISMDGKGRAHDNI